MLNELLMGPKLSKSNYKEYKILEAKGSNGSRFHCKIYRSAVILKLENIAFPYLER